MLKNSKEKGFQAKQGVSDGKKHTNFSKLPSATTAAASSRQWSAFRNPRIVRVSRSFGGKDRHSKVCTIRGLRDRRIRLSVPTAIQLYDLQDKLRLGQPSKVIDWLLEVTKLDIDKLPPLQIPAGFAQFHQQMLFPHHDSYSSSTSSQFSLPPSFFDVKDSSQFKDMEISQTLMGKSKLWDQAERGGNHDHSEKGKWINNSSNDHNQVGDYNEQGSVSAQKLFPMANSSSLPNYFLNNAAAFNYYTTTSDQFGNNNNNGVFPSPMEGQTSSSSASSAFFFCPPGSSNPSAAVFTPYPSLTNPFESHIQFLSSSSVHGFPNSFTPALQPFSSQNLKPSAGNLNLKQLLHSENNGGSGKDHEADAGNS